MIQRLKQGSESDVKQERESKDQLKIQLEQQLEVARNETKRELQMIFANHASFFH